MAPWGEGRRRRPQGSTRDRLLLLLNQTKSRKRGSSELDAPTNTSEPPPPPSPRVNDSKIAAPVSSAGVSENAIPAPSPASSSRGARSPLRRRNDNENECTGGRLGEGGANYDASPVSPHACAGVGALTRVPSRGIPSTASADCLPPAHGSGGVDVDDRSTTAAPDAEMLTTPLATTKRLLDEMNASRSGAESSANYSSTSNSTTTTLAGVALARSPVGHYYHPRLAVSGDEIISAVRAYQPNQRDRDQKANHVAGASPTASVAAASLTAKAHSVGTDGALAAPTAVPGNGYDGRVGADSNSAGAGHLTSRGGNCSDSDPRPSPLAVGVAGSRSRGVGDSTPRHGGAVTLATTASPAFEPPSPAGMGFPTDAVISGPESGLSPAVAGHSLNGAGSLLPPLTRRKSWESGGGTGGVIGAGAGVHGGGGGVATSSSGSSGNSSSNSTKISSQEKGIAGRAGSRGGGKRPALSSESDLPPTLGKRCPPPGNAGGGSGGAGGGFERGTPVGKSSTPAAGVVVTPSRLGIKAPLFPRASSGGSIGFGSGGDSNSSSAASTPASAAKGGRWTRNAAGGGSGGGAGIGKRVQHQQQQQHQHQPGVQRKLSRSESLGLSINRRTKALLSPWPSRSSSSASSSKSWTSSPGFAGGRGVSGTAVAAAVNAGKRGRFGRSGGGAGKNEFFRSDDVDADIVGGGTGDGVDETGNAGGSGGVGSASVVTVGPRLQRSYSDSAVVPPAATPRILGGLPSAAWKHQHQHSGSRTMAGRFSSSSGVINVTDGSGAMGSNRSRLSKLRSSKLLPSSMGWTAPFSLSRRATKAASPSHAAGANNERGGATPSTSSTPTDHVLEDVEEGPTASDQVTGNGNGTGGGGGIFERRGSAASIPHVERDGTSQFWISPLFRHRRWGSSRSGSGNHGTSGVVAEGASTAVSSARLQVPVPPSPAYKASPAPSSLDAEALSTPEDATTGLMKPAPPLSLQETRQRRQARELHAFSSKIFSAVAAASDSLGFDDEEESSTGDNPPSPTITDARTITEPVIAADRALGDEIDAKASRQSQKSGTQLSAALPTSGSAAPTVPADSIVSSRITPEGSSRTSAGVRLSASSVLGNEVPLSTPLQPKRAVVEPPRPPGRPPHAHRRQARLRRSASRVEPTDESADEEEHANVNNNADDISRSGGRARSPPPGDASPPPSAELSTVKGRLGAVAAGEARGGDGAAAAAGPGGPAECRDKISPLSSPLLPSLSHQLRKHKEILQQQIRFFCGAPTAPSAPKQEAPAVTAPALPPAAAVPAASEVGVPGDVVGEEAEGKGKRESKAVMATPATAGEEATGKPKADNVDATLEARGALEDPSRVSGTEGDGGLIILNEAVSTAGRAAVEQLSARSSCSAARGARTGSDPALMPSSARRISGKAATSGFFSSSMHGAGGLDQSLSGVGGDDGYLTARGGHSFFAPDRVVPPQYAGTVGIVGGIAASDRRRVFSSAPGVVSAFATRTAQGKGQLAGAATSLEGDAVGVPPSRPAARRSREERGKSSGEISAVSEPEAEMGRHKPAAYGDMLTASTATGSVCDTGGGYSGASSGTRSVSPGSMSPNPIMSPSLMHPDSLSPNFTVSPNFSVCPPSSVPVAGTADSEHAAAYEPEMAEAVLEEFTVDEEADEEEGGEGGVQGDRGTGDGGVEEAKGSGTGNRNKPPTRSASSSGGPRTRKPLWEAFIFTKGVFQEARQGGVGGTWTGTGNPVPSPPGICLVDQAKELRARRLYEISLCKKPVVLNDSVDEPPRSVDAGRGDSEGEAEAGGEVLPPPSCTGGDSQEGSTSKEVGALLRQQQQQQQQQRPTQRPAQRPAQRPLDEKWGVDVNGQDAAVDLDGDVHDVRNSSNCGNGKEDNSSTEERSPPSLSTTMSPATSASASASTTSFNPAYATSKPRSMSHMPPPLPPRPGVASSASKTATSTFQTSPIVAPLTGHLAAVPAIGSGVTKIDGGIGGNDTIGSEANLGKPSERTERPGYGASGGTPGSAGNVCGAARGVRSDNAGSGKSTAEGEGPPLAAVEGDVSEGTALSADAAVSRSGAALLKPPAPQMLVAGALAGATPGSRLAAIPASAMASRRAALINSSSGGGNSKACTRPRGTVDDPCEVTVDGDNDLIGPASVHTDGVSRDLLPAGVSSSAREKRAQGTGGVLNGSTDEGATVAIKRLGSCGEHPRPATTLAKTLVDRRRDDPKKREGGCLYGADGMSEDGGGCADCDNGGGGAIAPSEGEYMERVMDKRSKGTSGNEGGAKGGMHGSRERHVKGTQAESPTGHPSCSLECSATESATLGSASTKSIAAEAEAEAAAAAAAAAMDTTVEKSAVGRSSASCAALSEGGDSYHSARSYSRANSTGSNNGSSIIRTGAGSSGLMHGGNAASGTINSGSMHAGLESKAEDLDGGNRIAYRPRGISYGDKPWRLIDDKLAAHDGNTEGGGEELLRRQDSGSGGVGEAVAVPGGGTYRPVFGQGLVVSRGVTVKADVRVPHGTVTVTRGGQLRGRVIAREFLLEDGAKLEGEVECDFAVVEGHMLASLVSREVATIGPSARIAGDVIYNVLELDRGAVITGRLFSIRSTATTYPTEEASEAEKQQMQRRLQYAMKARRHGVARGDSPATRVSLQSDDDARAGDHPTEQSYAMSEGIGAGAASNAGGLGLGNACCSSTIPNRKVTSASRMKDSYVRMSSSSSCSGRQRKSRFSGVSEASYKDCAGSDDDHDVNDDSRGAGSGARGGRSTSAQGRAESVGSSSICSSPSCSVTIGKVEVVNDVVGADGARRCGGHRERREQTGGIGEADSARAHRGGQLSFGGLWGSVMEGVAWARAFSDGAMDERSDSRTTASDAMTQPPTTTDAKRGQPKDRSQERSMSRSGPVSDKDAKIRQVWIRAAERHAKLS